jgi:hypothetical protein
LSWMRSQTRATSREAQSLSEIPMVTARTSRFSSWIMRTVSRISSLVMKTMARGRARRGACSERCLRAGR